MGSAFKANSFTNSIMVGQKYYGKAFEKTIMGSAFKANSFTNKIHIKRYYGRAEDLLN